MQKKNSSALNQSFSQIFEFCSEVLAVGRGWLFVGGLVLLDGAGVPQTLIQTLQLPKTHSPKFH